MGLLRHSLLPIPFFAISLGAQPVEDSVNFVDNIAPILATNCVSCHHPEGIGPFSLVSFNDAHRRARQIAEVTQSGFMPPWKPSRDHGPNLIGERFLSQPEIKLLTQWYADGAPPGDLSNFTPITPPESTWDLGPPDLIIRLPEAYTLPAEGRDVYRNFAIPLPLNTTRFVRALQFRPGARSPIHHALVLIDETGRALAHDAAELGPGYDGMGIGSGSLPPGHIVGWTPGQAPYESYSGTAWAVTPQTDLVLQLHLLPTGRPEEISPEIGLYFTDEPPTRESFVFQLRDFKIDIPAGEPAYRIEQQITLPTPVSVVSIYPHTHYLGKDLQIFATLPSGVKEWLLHIPDWDFNWQGDYRLQTPLPLPAGSVLHLAYTYDNSTANPFNPANPPVDVKGGWSSTDEMAEAMIQVLPSSPSDLPRLATAQKNYDIAQAGGESRFHYFNGIYLEQQGEYAQALTAYQSALKLDPSFASTHYKLGTLWERRGEFQRAFDLYESALELKPEMISARLAIAKLLMQQHRFTAAGKIIQSVHAENPHHLLATLYLARFHLATGARFTALETFATNLPRFADVPQFHLEYGEALWQAGQNSTAKQQLEAATSFQPVQLEVGATAALQTVRASAHYLIALIHQDEAAPSRARNSLNDCLRASPFHLNALLLAANLAIHADDDAAALTHLKTLISLPENATFSDEDILANLPLPAGAHLLSAAHQAQQ